MFSQNGFKLEINLLSILYIRKHRPKKVRYKINTLRRYTNEHQHQGNKSDDYYKKVTYLYGVIKIEKILSTRKPYKSYNNTIMQQHLSR